jgi:two-component system, LytTR family, response regulator
MTLKTLIVDDEPLACDLLGLLLADHENIEVVAKCRNGQEALAYVQSRPVDLLFLDVQMPEMGGFDVVERLGVRQLPPTIFVTAYHEHAVRAFDVHAVDYLTKPVDPKRLSRALERVHEKIAARSALLTQEQLEAVLKGLKSATSTSSPYSSRLLVKDGEKEILLSVETIDWVEAQSYYSCLHAKGRRYMLRETISDLSDKLDPRHFVRIHRSSIVNLDYIREIYREGHSDSHVVLKDGQVLKMSKPGRQRLMEIGKV